MEIASLARQSVLAETSEFFRAELDAFRAHCRRHRPAGWVAIQRLQRVCIAESPATATGLRAAQAVIGQGVSA